MAAWLIAEWSTAGLLRAHPPVHGALHQRGAPCGACEWVPGCRAARSAGRGSRITGPVVSVRYEQAGRAAAPSGGRDAGGAGRTSCVAVVRYARADRWEGAGRSSGTLAVGFVLRAVLVAPCDPGCYSRAAGRWLGAPALAGLRLTAACLQNASCDAAGIRPVPTSYTDVVPRAAWRRTASRRVSTVTPATTSSAITRPVPGSTHGVADEGDCRGVSGVSWPNDA